MSTVAKSQIQFDASGFQSFIDGSDDPDWLIEGRKAAWKQFEALDWPGQKDEEWMRTDIRLFKLDKFAMPSECNQPLPASVFNTGVELGGHCHSHDGISVGAEVDPDLASKGVLFGNARQLLAEHSDTLKPYFHRAFDQNFDRFSALHAAFWSSGAILFVPRGVVVEKPLHLFSAMSDGGVDLSHTLVILEDGAEATVLAECQSPNVDASGMHCGGIELIVGDNAHLRYVNLQDWGQGV